MMTLKRLELYFDEAQKHIAKINKSLDLLQVVMPLTSEKYIHLNEPQQDKLDVLVFRFAKLQDLLGDKIFRNILEYSGFNTTQKPFVKLLSELEKEGLLELNKWIELRGVRNTIAHEYPDDEATIIESINYIYENIKFLIEVVDRMQRYFDEIKTVRTQ